MSKLLICFDCNEITRLDSDSIHDHFQFHFSNATERKLKEYQENYKVFLRENKIIDYEVTHAGKVDDLSTKPCECCNTHLVGERYEIIIPVRS